MFGGLTIMLGTGTYQELLLGHYRLYMTD